MKAACRLFITSNSGCYDCFRYIFHTESGVMCLDVHPEHSNLVAVGFYDGKVYRNFFYICIDYYYYYYLKKIKTKPNRYTRKNLSQISSSTLLTHN